MASTLERQSASLGGEPIHIPEVKKLKPVRYFAVAGLASVVLQVYVYGRWLLDGPERTYNLGPDKRPTWLSVSSHAIEILGCAVFFVAGYFMIWKPLRKDGRLHWDGYMFIGLWAMTWQDLWANMFTVWLRYSSAFYSWGSWYNYMPLMRLPHAEQLPEPVFATAFAYVWWDIGPIIMACFLMRKAKVRWPRLSMSNQLWLGFVWTCAAEFVMETLFMRLGYYGYNTAIHALTLDVGTRYQLPLHEGLMWGAVMFSIAAVRYCRDDKGRSVVERGIDEMHLTRRQQGWMRGLALVGLTNLAFFFLYNVPAAIVSTAGDTPVPKEVAEKSYYNMLVCGHGTDRECGGPDVPAPLSNRSIYINPEGKPVYPEGNKFAPSK